MVHDNQLKAAYDRDTGKYDFSGYFRNIAHYIREADVAVCNLETTIGGGTPSGYPKFNTPEEIADAISQAGFACVATANNHSFDSGADGIKKTREALEKRNLKVIGTRKNPREQAYSLLEVNGVTVALLNFTYETGRVNGKRTLNNRVIGETGHKLINSFGFDSLEEDMETVAREVAAVRAAGAKVVIAYFHWGNEYERYSNIFQNYVAWRAAHMGVDAIIGSHSHVMQELSHITVPTARGDKTVPVFYGLGNYIWGAPPMQGRDTVLNNVLARLDITLDEATGTVTAEPSHIPLYISIRKNQFYTVDLKGIAGEEQATFQKTFGIPLATVQAQIAETIEDKLRPAPIAMHFDKIFRLHTGERVSLLEGFLPDKKYVRFRCEDAIIASVLQNGYVIGNSAGYVGISATDEEGTETRCMVQVLPGKPGTFPVLVNEHNSVRDIYLPPNRVTGEEYGLSVYSSLCMDAAIAWKEMHTAAANEGIYLNLVYTFRNKKTQLERRNRYARLYGAPAADRRYQKIGCSEHHLAVALDVNGGKFGDLVTPKADAIEWVQKNCHKFGFVARKLHTAMKYTPYVHLRYLDDHCLARYLSENELTLEAYLENHEQYAAEYQRFSEQYAPLCAPSKTQRTARTKAQMKKWSGALRSVIQRLPSRGR